MYAVFGFGFRLSFRFKFRFRPTEDTSGESTMHAVCARACVREGIYREREQERERECARERERARLSRAGMGASIQCMLRRI